MRSFEVIHTTNPQPRRVSDLPLICYDGDHGDAHLLPLISFPVLYKEKDFFKVVGVDLWMREAK
jgi:hypothetical protein